MKAQRNGEGFILQAPAARESGGKYFLDEAIITAVGSDFHSVSESRAERLRQRMEVVIPPERLEQTLNVFIHQRNHTLAAFDQKDIARAYLGIKLPTLEVIEPEALESLNQLQTRASTLEPLESPQPMASPARHVSKPSAQTSEKSAAIAPAKQQKGMLEKRLVRFLEEAGIRLSVMQGEAFHLRIEHEPYIPLVIERQGHALMFTHYLEQNGDTFIDAEMVFTIQPNGQLQFKETAVQDPIRGGEWRSPDRLFAQVFARNLLEQGFAEAARKQVEHQQTKSATVVVPTLFDPHPFIATAADNITIAGDDPIWEQLPTAQTAGQDTDGDGLSDAVE